MKPASEMTTTELMLADQEIGGDIADAFDGNSVDLIRARMRRRREIRYELERRHEIVIEAYRLGATISHGRTGFPTE